MKGFLSAFYLTSFSYKFIVNSEPLNGNEDVDDSNLDARADPVNTAEQEEELEVGPVKIGLLILRLQLFISMC